MKTVLYGPSNITIVLESMKIPEKLGGVLDIDQSILIDPLSQ